MIALSPPPTSATRFDTLIEMPATDSGPPSSNGSNSPRSTYRGLPAQPGSSSPHRLPKPAQLQRLQGSNAATTSSPSLPSTSSQSPLSSQHPSSISAASLTHLPPPASPSATSPLLFVPSSGFNDPNFAPISSTFTPSASPARRKGIASPRSSFGTSASSPSSAANLPNLGSTTVRPSFNFYNQSPPAPSSGSNILRTTSPRATSPDESVASSSAAYTTSSMSQAHRPIGSTSSLASSSSLAPSASIHGGSTHSGYSSHMSSRHSSRRPSLVTLQSFLEGVNHVTRVRSPSLRGHSRSGSLDESLAGSGFFRKDSVLGNKPWHEDDIEEIPSWDDHQLLTPHSPTPRRADFRSRNTSLHSLRPAKFDLFTPDSEPPLSPFSSTPVPIRASNALDFGTTAEDDYDEYAERTFVDRREGAFFPDHIQQEDEERHLHNLDEESLWTEQDLNTLQEGDRIGIGLDLEGYPIVDALEGGPESPLRMPDDGIQYEVVRQLGYGSYAIVYLVKEVLYDHSEDEAPFPQDYDSSSGRSQSTVYGREFALKCLSKRNLSEEQIAVQKFEATLHKQLPEHKNVVALLRAMETPVWLFLLLEYCPGQDLFFWLEQARDVEGIDGEPSRAPSRLSSRAPVPTSMVNRSWHNTASAAPSPPLGQSPHTFPFDDKEATPPSPSLLAATIDTALLSRRRLRLISRMFGQMCDGLQACHDAGVSHRDIKPENIIIVDNRAELGSGGKVAIKITDWGLGTSDKRCEDFDCGSKPYMAYECRNNIMPSYEPKAADVWSLGIVLLNLLFHRCPWADPTLDDPDFSAYNHNPVKFLETRFQGIGSEVATFLANRVFTEVEDIPTTTPKERVTAGEFGKWAKQLVRYMGEGSRRASISESTVQLVSTTRQSPRLDDKRVFQSPPTHSPRRSLQLPRDDVEASPSRTMFRSSELPNDLIKELERVDREQRQAAVAVEGGDLIESMSETVERLDLEETTKEAGDEQDNETEAEKERKERHRRRKRGARKAKALKPDSADAVSPDGTESRSPNRSWSGTLADGNALAPSPDISITEATQSIQAFAREISQTTKPPLSSSNSYSTEGTVKSRPAKSRFADRFKGAFANGNADLQAFQQRARDRELALTGGVDYNNPTASAPAKMQHGTSSFGSVASTGSWSEDGKGQSHWASTGSRRERLDRSKQQPHSASGSRDRGRINDEGTSSLGGRAESRSGRPAHSSRNRQHISGASQYSPSTIGSSPSRQSSTPLSSFSSSTSYESSRSPAGRAAGVSRSPLHSIEERVKDSPSIPVIVSHTGPSVHQAIPQSSHQVIREPLPPPVEPVRPTTLPATQKQQQPETPPAPKAKLGRLFKFTRG